MLENFWQKHFRYIIIPIHICVKHLVTTQIIPMLLYSYTRPWVQVYVFSKHCQYIIKSWNALKKEFKDLSSYQCILTIIRFYVTLQPYYYTHLLANFWIPSFSAYSSFLDTFWYFIILCQSGENSSFLAGKWKKIQYTYYIINFPYFGFSVYLMISII